LDWIGLGKMDPCPTLLEPADSISCDRKTAVGRASGLWYHRRCRVFWRIRRTLQIKWKLKENPARKRQRTGKDADVELHWRHELQAPQVTMCHWVDLCFKRKLKIWRRDLTINQSINHGFLEWP